VGLAGVITPIDAERAVILRDWPVMAVLTLAVLIFGIGWRGRQGRINRFEGGALLLVYLAYNAYLISSEMV